MEARTKIQHAVNTTNIAKQRYTALYNILYENFPKFSREIINILGKRLVIKMTTQPACLIILEKDDTIINLYDNASYKLCNRHLRIDKTYSEETPNLSPCHYTEVYLSRELDSQIVMHAYFNALGNYTHAQLQQTILSANTITPLAISKENLQNILKNITPASKLLGDLLKYKNDLYKEEMDKSYTLLRELETLSRNINTPGGFTKYKEKCDIFQKCIHKINKLHERYFDPRGKAVEKILRCFSDNKCSIQPTNCTNAIPVDIEPRLNQTSITYPLISEGYKNSSSKQTLASTKTSTTHDKQPDDSSIYSKLCEKIEGHIAQISLILTSNNISNDCQKLHDLISDMQLASLEIFDLPKTYHNTAKMQQLKPMLNKATNFIKDSLINAIKTRDIQTLEKIFPISQHYLDFDFYESFINNLETASAPSKNNPDIDKLFAVCDFLYEHSPVFRNAMLPLIYSFRSHPDTNFFNSILLDLYRQGNLQLFKKLISYGVNCIIGIINADNDQCVTLISEIIISEQAVRIPAIPYVETILANNTVLLSGKDFSQNYGVAYPLDKKKHLNSVSNQNGPMISLYNELYELHPLEVAIRNLKSINSRIVEILVPHSSLAALALCLARISFEPSISLQISGVSQSTHKNADKLAILLSVAKGATINLKKATTCIYENLTSDTRKLPNQNAKINLSVQQILNNNSYGNNNRYGRQNTSYKMIQLKACLFLLTQKSSLDLQDYLHAENLFNELLELAHKNENLSKGSITAIEKDQSNFIQYRKSKNNLTNTTPQKTPFITTQYNGSINKEKNRLLINIIQATRKNNNVELFGNLQNPICDLININDYSMSATSKQTALHYACINNSYLCAKLLILCGADPYLENSENKNCLDLLSDNNIKLALDDLHYRYAEIVENVPALATVIKNAFFGEKQTCLDNHLLFIATIENKYFPNKTPLTTGVEHKHLRS